MRIEGGKDGNSGLEGKEAKKGGKEKKIMCEKS